MRFLFAFLMLAALAICSQPQLSFKNEVPVVTSGASNENPAGECSTSTLREVVTWSVRVSKKTPLAWLMGEKAVQFVDFYTRIVPYSSDQVVDTVVILDYRGKPKVLAMLFSQDCLVTASPLEDSLFDEVMGAIGAEGRKPSEIERLIISSPPGFNI